MTGKVVVVALLPALVAATRIAHADATDSVSYSGLAFADDKCETKFGGTGKLTGDDIVALGDCLKAQNPVHMGAGRWVAVHGDLHLTYEVVLTRGKITSVGPAFSNKDDASLPTIADWIDLSSFAPSKTLADSLAKKNVTPGLLRLKVCFDAGGAITSARVTTPSGSTDFDKEATAWAKKQKVKALVVGGKKKIAACSISERQSDAGVEGGEEGGVVGGDVNGYAPPPPPPPPPPPAPPQVVPPKALESSRTGGNPEIRPDEASRKQIIKDGKDKVVSSWKLCLDNKGVISTVSMLKSSGYPGYDTKIETTMRTTWTYSPYILNGKAVPVCSAVTFIYSQK